MGRVLPPLGLERRGVWYLIETGIRGLLVPDERGWAVCYMVCEPATHYYRVMTGSERMPVLALDAGFARQSPSPYSSRAPPSFA